jgi:hypothetical protein
MSKRLMMLALAAVSAAMFALPAAASAGNWHLEPTNGSTTGPTITISAGKTTLSTTSGLSILGEGVDGTATFNASSTTTGVISAGLTFTNVKELGVKCEQTGQVAGTVVSTPLTFHLEKIDTETPGILIKPNNAEHHFATFKCLGVTIKVTGNGILGDVTNACSSEIESGTAVWQTNGTAGNQKYQQVTTTGEKWDLSADVGSETPTAAMEATGTLKLSTKSKINCTLP